MTLLAAISQRTQRLRLGTACLVSSMRNPLYLALEWATLDALSGGRTIFGPCMGNPEQGVRREFEALGLPFSDRATVFEEGLEVLNELFRTGKTNFKGKYYSYDDVEFHSGTEMAPLRPLQTPPPIWIVSNPRLVGDKPTEKMRAIMERACDRIIRLGDGWMTCCRAEHPEELTEQIGYLQRRPARHGRDFDDYTVSYQVTMNIGESKEQARADFDDYISKYYPELSRAMDLSNWGPVGTPDDIVDVAAGVPRPRRDALHLPLRRDRSVRAGPALRTRGAARIPDTGGEVTMSVTETSQTARPSRSARTPSWWSTSACRSRPTTW